MEYDPERELWLPGRRKFIFLLGSALVLPKLELPQKTISLLVYGRVGKHGKFDIWRDFPADSVEGSPWLVSLGVDEVVLNSAVVAGISADRVVYCWKGTDLWTTQRTNLWSTL